MSLDGGFRAIGPLLDRRRVRHIRALALHPRPVSRSDITKAACAIAERFALVGDRNRKLLEVALMLIEQDRNVARARRGHRPVDAAGQVQDVAVEGGAPQMDAFANLAAGEQMLQTELGRTGPTHRIRRYEIVARRPDGRRRLAGQTLEVVVELILAVGMDLPG